MAIRDDSGLLARSGVILWQCPDCAFAFDASHTDNDGSYSCPCCAEARLTTALSSSNEMLGRAAPMLDRLAHYEGNVNQPAKALADEIRALLQSLQANKGDGSNG